MIERIVFIATWCLAFERGDEAEIRRGFPRIAYYSVVWLAILFAVALAAHAQDCPVDKVCISPEAARKAVETAAERDALKIEVQALKDAINGREAIADKPAVKGYKDIINECKVEFARVSGEYTGFKQGAVRVDAAFDTAIKNTRKKCSPLSILCL